MKPGKVMRMGNPKKTLQDRDAARVRSAKATLEAAQHAYRQAVLDAMANGASFREVSRVTGLATSTLGAWKKAAN